jgi:hypothetical protein
MLVAMKQSPITRDPKHTAFVLVFIDPPAIINVVAAGCRITVNQETHPSAHSFIHYCPFPMRCTFIVVLPCTSWPRAAIAVVPETTMPAANPQPTKNAIDFMLILLMFSLFVLHFQDIAGKSSLHRQFGQLST